jgi:hypothetical protein
MQLWRCPTRRQTLRNLWRLEHGAASSITVSHENEP